MTTELELHLRKLGKENTAFSIKDLKKAFPKEKNVIDRYTFIGIIEKDLVSGAYRSKIN